MITPSSGKPPGDDSTRSNLALALSLMMLLAAIITIILMIYGQSSDRQATAERADADATSHSFELTAQHIRSEQLREAELQNRNLDEQRRTLEDQKLILQNQLSLNAELVRLQNILIELTAQRSQLEEQYAANRSNAKLEQQIAELEAKKQEIDQLIWEIRSLLGTPMPPQMAAINPDDWPGDMGPTSYDTGPTNRSPVIRNVIVRANLHNCVPKDGWMRIYTLTDKNQWERLPGSFTSMDGDGYVMVPGIELNITRFGGRGEPVKIEQVVNNVVVDSIGDVPVGEQEFRLFPGDNFTPWFCR